MRGNDDCRTFEGLQTSSLACFQHLFFGSDLLSAGATVDSKINSEQVIVDSSYTNTQQRLNSHIWCSCRKKEALEVSEMQPV